METRKNVTFTSADVLMGARSGQGKGSKWGLASEGLPGALGFRAGFSLGHGLGFRLLLVGGGGR